MMPTLTLREIAAIVDGRLLRDTDADVRIQGLSAIDDARTGTLTFCAHEKYRDALSRTQASAVVISETLVAALEPAGLPAIPMVVCEVADYGFAQVAEKLLADYPPRQPGIHPTAVVAPTAIIGADVCVQPYAVIDEQAVVGDGCIIESFAYIGYKARLGKRCRIYQHAVVREHCHLGCDVILQPGAIVGGDGFGYTLVGGQIKKIPQLGNVVIEDDAELGANTTVDRARFKHTIIERFVKLDNLVQVAHNCEIGMGTMVAAQTGFAGSAKVGKFCQFGGQVGMGGHIAVGDKAIFGARSAIANSLAGDQTYLGEPAMPAFTFKRILAGMNRLPEMVKEHRDMRRRLADLEAKLAALTPPTPDSGAPPVP